MRPAAILVSVLVLAVAAGVYFGLETLYPNKAEVATSAPQPEAATPVAAAPNESAPAAAPATSTASADQPVEPSEPAPQAAPAPAEEPAATPPPAELPTAPKKAKVKAPKAEHAQVASAEPATSSPAPQPRAKAPPAADAIMHWWPDPSKMADGQLKLTYAGPTQGEPAIGLFFSAAPKPESLPANVEVRDDSGATVHGDWSLGKNPRLALFRVAKPGRYTVILQPTLADTTGHLLGTPLQGPVYVQ